MLLLPVAAAAQLRSFHRPIRVLWLFLFRTMALPVAMRKSNSVQASAVAVSVVPSQSAH